MSPSADMAEQQQWRDGSSSLWVVLLRSRLLVLLLSMFVYSLGELDACLNYLSRAASMQARQPGHFEHMFRVVYSCKHLLPVYLQ